MVEIVYKSSTSDKNVIYIINALLNKYNIKICLT